MVNSRSFLNTFLILAILSLATIASYPGAIASTVRDDSDSSDAITDVLSSSHTQFSRKDNIVPFSFDWSTSDFLISVRVILFAALLLFAISRIEKSIARYFTGRSPPEILGLSF